MNKIIGFSFVATVSIVVVSILSLWLFNSGILRTNSPAFMKSLAQIFFPPEDLYEVLLSEPVDLSIIPLENQTTFSHKYHGAYEVGLIFSAFSSNDYFSNSLLSVTSKIECRLGDEIIYSSSSYEGEPFLGRYGNGFSLLSYEVPENLSLDKSIGCSISILQVDAKAVVDYGSAKVVVRRSSSI